ncbi:formate--tetrahydrofolate ligase, partial [Enterococcus faecium]|uniref:formate--tetrahydrofolate ligase n=1 Tax=Enterococcus faecium TaxID=1352 RepID=UPI0034E9367B
LGFANLKRHVENMRRFQVPVVVAINEFVADTEAEIATLKALCADINVPVELASVWANGAEGGVELAKTVVRVIDQESSDYKRLYADEDSLEEKVT